jgi:hypothetical protein
MAKKDSRIDPKSKADFDKAITDFAEQVKVDRDIITNEQMRLMLRDAMTFTPPMPKGGGRGLSDAAHKAGMNKTGNDIKRIFIPQDKPVKGRTVFLRQVINAVKGNDTQTFFQLHQNVTESKIESLSPVMRKIMEDTDWQRAQAKARNYLSKASIMGRGNKVAGMATNLRGIHDQAKGAVGGRWPKFSRYIGPQYFAKSSDALNAYIAERQQKVGRVKAGWASAMKLIPPLVTSKGKARNLGVYNAPWVDLNRSAMGQFTMNKTPQSISMTATNLIGNINNVASDAGTENIVYGNRVKQLNNTVQARIRDAIDRANKRK